MTTSGWRTVVATLTTARVAIGLSLALALDWIPAVALVPLALAAAATDGLDGWIARGRNAATPFGAAFDLAADGVFFTACLFACWRLELWPAWLLAVLIAAGVPEAGAQLILLLRHRRMGSPRRWWNRALGGYSYLCVVAVFAGSSPRAWGLGLAALAWAANTADLAWALDRRPD